MSWRARYSDGGMQAVAQTIDLSDGNGPQQSKLYVPLRCHDGSTLASVAVNFRVGFPHATPPPQMPQARVLRFSLNSSSIVPLTSMAAGAVDQNGTVVCGSAPSGTWAGQQYIEILCDQNNAIDLSQYQYMVEIDEEAGLTGYPWALVAKQPVAAATASGEDIDGNALNPTTIDGVIVNGSFLGARILLKNQDGSPNANNAIYVTTGNGLNYPLDMSQPSDFSRGMIVPVQNGLTNPASYWQVGTNRVDWTPNGPASPGVAGANFYWVASTAYPRGTRVVPTGGNGYYYTSLTAAGVSDPATEPTWPTQIGTTVLDGSVVWVCSGQTYPNNLLFFPRPQADDETPATAGSAFFAHGNIYQAVTATFTGIVDGHFQ